MTRSKHILALVVALVALVALAPAASASDGADRVKWNLVDPSKKKFFAAARTRAPARSIQIRSDTARSSWTGGTLVESA